MIGSATVFGVVLVVSLLLVLSAADPEKASFESISRSGIKTDWGILSLAHNLTQPLLRCDRRGVAIPPSEWFYSARKATGYRSLTNANTLD